MKSGGNDKFQTIEMDLSADERDSFTKQKWHSKQTKIVRHISDGGHPDINPEMFVHYAEVRIDAAIDLLKRTNGNEQKIAKLEKFKNEYLQGFFSEVDYSALEFLKIKLASIADQNSNFYFKVNQQFNREFDKVYNQNIEKMQQINALLAESVNPNEKSEKVIKQINERASELRTLEVRPILEHHYEVDGVKVTSSHIPEGWLISEQESLKTKVYQTMHPGVTDPQVGPYTTPSTITNDKQVGQRNAVRSEIQVGDDEFIGHRHGSPSVLKMNNQAKRQHRNLLNVKQTITLAAQHQFDADNHQPNDVLRVDIATMSLLSPIMPDHKIGNKLDPMQQYRQVEDMRHAFWSLHGRNIQVTVKDKNGQPHTITVQPQINYMSIGVNAVRGIGTPAAKDLVRRINNRGINQFIESFAYDTNTFKEATKELKAVIKEINQIENNDDIKKYNNQLNSFDRTSLTAAYKTLEKANAELSADSDLEPDKKKLNKDRKEALKVITREEKKLDQINKDLADARQKAYSPHIAGWKEKLDKLQTNEGTNKSFKKTRLFVDSLDIYYNQPQPGIKRFLAVKRKASEQKKAIKAIFKIDEKIKLAVNDQERNDLLNQSAALHEKVNALQQEINFLNKSNYRFQSRFIIASGLMGKYADWQCKSGEDRTALLNEQIEAHYIFNKTQGHPPRWDNEEDNDKYYGIMQKVHNGSPNRVTTGYNDNAPGLKVTQTDYAIRYVDYTNDKKIANIQSNASKLHGYTLKDKIKHAFGIPSKSKLKAQEAERSKRLRGKVDKFILSQSQKEDNVSEPQRSLLPSFVSHNSGSLQHETKTENIKVEKWVPSKRPKSG